MFEKYIAARRWISAHYQGDEDQARAVLQFNKLCAASGNPEAIMVGKLLLAWVAGEAAKPTGPNQRTGKGTWARRF